jgi:hypothetical protein
MTFPHLANTFRAIAEHGHAGFYTGRIAQAVVDLVRAGGGVMKLDDLAGQEAQVVDPICYEFKRGKEGEEGVTLWEVCFTFARSFRFSCLVPLFFLWGFLYSIEGSSLMIFALG